MCHTGPLSSVLYSELVAKNIYQFTYEMAGIDRSDIYIIDKESRIVCMGRKECNNSSSGSITSGVLAQSERFFAREEFCAGGVNQQLSSEPSAPAHGFLNFKCTNHRRHCLLHNLKIVGSLSVHTKLHEIICGLHVMLVCITLLLIIFPI